MKRRALLASAGSAAGLLLLARRMAMAQVNSGTGALTRKDALSDRALALLDIPALAFRTALPEGREWLESPQPVKDFDAAGMFARFYRLWLDKTDEGGNSVIGVFGIAIPAGAKAMRRCAKSPPRYRIC